MAENPHVGKEYFVESLAPDHRTLFTLEEVTAAYRKVLSERDAIEAARETMEGPIVPRRPASFSDYLLELLAGLSSDTARRVRIAQGYHEG